MQPSESTKAHGLLALYVVLVVGVAAGLLVKLWTDSDLPTVPPLAFAFWFLLTLATEIFWLPAPGS
jgi:hypothetical protein